MARVKVLAARVSGEKIGVPNFVYTAQIFEDLNDAEPIWVCVHEHRTTMAAQLCGVQFLTDRLLVRRRRETT